MHRPVDGDPCDDSKNPIGRTFSARVDSDLSGSRIFAETGKSRLSVKPHPVGGELHYLYFILKLNYDKIKYEFAARFR
jgi:hypothetical protein